MLFPRSQSEKGETAPSRTVAGTVTSRALENMLVSSLLPPPPDLIPTGLPICGVSGVAGPTPKDEKQSAAELDLVLQRHQNLQEKLAEEMLGLARSLKANTLAAQSVVKKDNQV